VNHKKKASLRDMIDV